MIQVPLVDLDLRGGASVLPLRCDYEHALVALCGRVLVDDTVVDPGHLAYLGIGRDEFAVVADHPHTSCSSAWRRSASRCSCRGTSSPAPTKRSWPRTPTGHWPRAVRTRGATSLASTSAHGPGANDADATTTRTPAGFFGYSSPMNTLEHDRCPDAWRAFGACVERPRAVLVISAHWYTGATAVTAMTRPRTIHDFYQG